MGRYLLIANPDKQQFVTEHSYGCSAKSSSYMHGMTAHAVALLVCKPTDVSNDTYDQLAGSWYGDRVIAAGDDYCPPNQDGIQTATPGAPERNLYEMACDEFEDISHSAMLMMSRADTWFADRFVRLAKELDTKLFLVLAKCAIEDDSETLQVALEAVNGANWKTKYRRACEKYSS